MRERTLTCSNINFHVVVYVVTSKSSTDNFDLQMGSSFNPVLAYVCVICALRRVE